MRSICLLIVCLLLAPTSLAQEAIPVDRIHRGIPVTLPVAIVPSAQGEDQEQEEEDGTKKESEEEEQDLISVTKPEVQTKEMLLHLWDGTVIAGELSTAEITVSTDYGTLNIPVDKVVEATPGLDSYPQILTNLDTLVEQLGANDYNTRQKARKELAGMGLKIKHELDRFGDGGNAERKKHLDELKKELLRLEEEADDFEEEENPIRPFIRGDSLTTPTFTVVGKIQQEVFQVKSKYGLLTVKLQDVKKIDRPRAAGGEIRRSIVVTGGHFIQSNLKSSGIRVNKGDIITVSAEGSITMTPWGSNRTSTPDGSTSYGWYINNQIAGGALAAKIGDSGQPINVGSRKRFVAKKSGVLKFGIGMQAAYASGSYNFPGQYKVKVTVKAGE